MSHLALQESEGPSDQQGLGQSTSQSSQSSLQYAQDSPTIGRAQIQPHPFAGQAINGSGSHSPLPTPSRSQRKPAPSPLHASTAISPPSSASSSPSRSDFPSPPHPTQSSRTPPKIATTASQVERTPKSAAQTTYYDSDSSGAETSEDSSPGPDPSRRLPNDARGAPGRVVTEKPLGVAIKPSPAMAGLSPTSRGEPAKGTPRNSSIDSAISAISSRSQPNKMAPEGQSPTPEIASLIKTAGSAEAVIRYLLKEKQSQSQQNSQLWRLVDKQRAMILGLNKDLERALKDKEKYRKKLKEVMAVTDVPPLPSAPPAEAARPPAAKTTADSSSKTRVLEIPVSPGLDSDSQKHSPIDMTLAPYPITPPADQLPGGPPSAVGDMLDPAHTMPKSSEHALDQFDHDKQERDAEAERRRADAAKDLPINLSLPPSRSLPSEPPRVPPPRLPPVPPPSTSAFEAAPMVDEGIAQYPPPAAPPPRKLPPAPLQLRNLQQQSPTIPPDDELETDSDYDDILEVDEMKLDERRGRRRTREEDERNREILALKEAEVRSLSMKSKKSNSSLKGTNQAAMQSEIQVSPRLAQSKTKGTLQRDNIPASLAGILNGSVAPDPEFAAPPALLSPGLPSSPRPMGMKSPGMTSPPLSPLGVTAFPGTPLSPRPPRQPIPLPINTPLLTGPLGEPLTLTSPKPLNILKKVTESAQPSPTKSSRGSPTERSRIFKGFVTEDYSDLLLPPNALPSIDIRVASSRMKPSRASLLSLTQLEEDPVFTLAIFSRADGGELWRVEKDSASLSKLDQRLKQCSTFTAKTPERSLFTGHAPAKLDARRLALDHYLDELLNTPLDNATALELCRYLSTNTLPPNADETGSSNSVQTSTKDTVPKTGPGGRPFRSGYLTKRGKNFGGWKARVFVLDGPNLRYYETPGGAHLGTIKLPRSQIGKQSQHNNDGASPVRAPSGSEDIDNQYRHAFLILEPKKKDPNSITKHVLCAESDEERDQWVDALLRWIDYRDADDDEPATSKKEQTHDRQDRASGINAKRRTQLQARQQHHQNANESENSLIGVSYEATRQGDIPQGAPSRSKNGPHHDYDSPHNHAQTMTSQQSYSISAPRDPQVISDSASWGSKLGMGLAPPNQEEKKARKRSFFGFGPKTRTSSDGQDSLFGSDNGPAQSGPSASQQSGPVRQVFGASLAEAVRYNSPVDVDVPLPAVVYRCIQYLDYKNATSEEGIFRLSGSNVVIKQLRERFNNESDVNLITDEQYHDIHAVASLLKLYLRELPTTILTRDLHMEFVSVTEMTNQKEKIAALGELVERLPQANATLLKYLIAFLIKIINNQDVNKMTVRNVGIVFSPTLNIPAPVFALFLQNYEPVFGIDPIDYELPSPVSERERRPSNPERPSFQDRRPSDSQPRPSTSGTGSSSPHRQRLMEAVLEGQSQRNGQRGTPTPNGQRSTPTPPPAPLMSMQQMAQLNAAQRSTPTPPPQRLTSYEPSFLAQQNQAGSHISLRPAYDSGFVVPNGYDVTQFHPQPPSQRSQPGYDRPIYEPGAPVPYDQPYSAKSRRESGMFLGPAGLNNQGSRSRLREEAQF